VSRFRRRWLSYLNGVTKGTGLRRSEKQHAGKLVGQVGDELRDMDYQSLKRCDGSVMLNGSRRANIGVAPLPSRK
jgi:hypothetical protein